MWARALSRLMTLGYVIVVLVAVLNETSGGSVVSPAETAFVRFSEGAPIINNDAKEEVFAVFHSRHRKRRSIFVPMESAFQAHRKHFEYSFPFLARLHDWRDQQLISIVNSRGTVWPELANAESRADVLNDGGSFSIISDAISDEGLKSSGVLGISLQPLNSKGKDVGSLQVDECFLGCVSGLLSGSGADHGGQRGLSGSGDKFFHLAGLRDGSIDALTQFPSLVAEDEKLPDEHNQLRRTDDDQPSIEAFDRIIIRRFLFAVLSFSGAFGIGLWGWQCSYNKRRSLGASLIGCGMLLGCIGLGLLWLTGFTSTWGWIL